MLKLGVYKRCQLTQPFIHKTAYLSGATMLISPFSIFALSGARGRHCWELVFLTEKY